MDHEIFPIVGPEETLEELAIKLRKALDSDAGIEQGTRQEWTESKLHLIEMLFTAYARFDDNEAFGVWLARNNLDDLGKDTRWAAINLGRDMNLTRTLLLESDSHSLKVIWRANQGRYQDATSLRIVPRSDTAELPRQTAQPAAIPLLNRAPESTKTDLERKFGRKIGQPLFNHFDGGKSGDRATRTTKKLCTKLSREQAAKLAHFVQTTKDLPKPTNSDGRLGLRTLWRDAPEGFCKKYEIGLTEGEAIAAVIEDWPTKIVPVLTQWREAGSPEEGKSRDSSRWYARIAPAVAAAPRVATPEQMANTHRMVATMVADVGKPRADLSCRPANHGPIRHFGVDIWTETGVFPYCFEEAWQVTTFWRTIDDQLRHAEPNARTRVAPLLKICIGTMSNINPVASVVLSKLLYAQCNHSDATGPESNFCPAYDSVQ